MKHLLYKLFSLKHTLSSAVRSLPSYIHPSPSIEHTFRALVHRLPSVIHSLPSLIPSLSSTTVHRLPSYIHPSPSIEHTLRAHVYRLPSLVHPLPSQVFALPSRAISLAVTRALAIVVALALFVSCTKVDTVIVIEPEVLSYNYLGNGAEWDPYCEAQQWGAPVTEEMWGTIFERTDYMRMSLVRCMINSPFRYFDKQNGSFDKERNVESLKKMLEYCQKNSITVMYGEFNPPTPEMKCDQRWVEMSVEYLNYLVVDCGFTCIKYFIPTNEPDGNWSVYDGNYDLYVEMVNKFHKEIRKYPELAGHIKFAAPDVVLGYKNPKYNMDNSAWVSRASKEIDSLTGIYEIHAYPGYEQVRSGEFARMFKEVLKEVPAGKQMVLGEAGYKAGKEADTLENRIHQEKLGKTTLIENKEGADCNMRVYDFEYGLDMALLAMEVMNSGGSGVAVWMLDDSHSVGDKGDIRNVKIWGMWNIFGSKVWNMKEQENIRPWYYAWSLMCRCFPAGSSILSVKNSGNNSAKSSENNNISPQNNNIKVVAATKDGKLSVALLNLSTERIKMTVMVPVELKNAKIYRYEKGGSGTPGQLSSKPENRTVSAEKSFSIEINAQSLVVVSDL